MIVPPLRKRGRRRTVPDRPTARSVRIRHSSLPITRNHNENPFSAVAVMLLSADGEQSQQHSESVAAVRDHRLDSGVRRNTGNLGRTVC
jgi:hypothetical protein